MIRRSGNKWTCVLFSRQVSLRTFFSSRDCTPLRVGSARARGRRERLGTIVSSFATVQRSVSRVSIARNDDGESSISTRSTILFRGDTSRRSRGTVRRNADMPRSRQNSTRRGNAIISRCSLLYLSIALIVSSARLVSGQRWVRALSDACLCSPSSR